MKLRQAIATLGMAAAMGGSLLLSAPTVQAQEVYYSVSSSYRASGQHTSYQHDYNHDYDRDHDRDSYRRAIDRAYQRAANELQRIREDSRLPSAVRNQLIDRYVGILNYLNSVRDMHHNW